MDKWQKNSSTFCHRFERFRVKLLTKAITNVLWAMSLSLNNLSKSRIGWKCTNFHSPFFFFHHKICWETWVEIPFKRQLWTRFPLSLLLIVNVLSIQLSKHSWASFYNRCSTSFLLQFFDFQRKFYSHFWWKFMTCNYCINPECKDNREWLSFSWTFIHSRCKIILTEREKTNCCK